MTTDRSRTARLLPLVAGAALLLAACGSSTTGSPVPAAPGAGTVVSSSDAGSSPSLDEGTPGPSDSSGSSDGTSGSSDGTSGSSDGTSGSSDQNATPAGDTAVRIANTYRPAKGETGSAIDVWSGYPINGGKKLFTVPYGTVSSYVAPPVTDPDSQQFTLNFYTAGSTSDDASLGNQSETGAPGLKLTVLVAATDPTDDNAAGASIKVYADAVGTKPGDSGFPTPSLPTPAAGKAVLLLDALSLQGRGGTNDGFTPSGIDGKCLPYYEENTAGSGFSTTLHDMASDTIDLFGGSGDHAYQVSPGSQVRVNAPKEDQPIPAACADTPVVGPFDPKLSAGQGAYGFLYGTDLPHAKVLLVPVG